MHFNCMAFVEIRFSENLRANIFFGCVWVLTPIGADLEWPNVVKEKNVDILNVFAKNKQKNANIFDDRSKFSLKINETPTLFLITQLGLRGKIEKYFRPNCFMEILTFPSLNFFICAILGLLWLLHSIGINFELIFRALSGHLWNVLKISILSLHKPSLHLRWNKKKFTGKKWCARSRKRL